MATTFTTPQGHHGLSGLFHKTTREKKAEQPSIVKAFVGDLLEDVQQKPLQAAEFAKHDMFREHINAMSISYFALIVLLIAASLPVLAYSVQYLVAY